MCPNGIRAKWTFGHRMAVMSGATGPTGATPETIAATPAARQFVGNWLKYWLSNQMVGSDPNPVLPRSKIRDNLLNQWFTASNCIPNPTTTDPVGDCPILDLTAAPFRLEAIVNESICLASTTRPGAPARASSASCLACTIEPARKAR
jgi:hypothetical protein